MDRPAGTHTHTNGWLGNAEVLAFADEVAVQIIGLHELGHAHAVAAADAGKCVAPHHFVRASAAGGGGPGTGVIAARVACTGGRGLTVGRLRVTRLSVPAGGWLTVGRAAIVGIGSPIGGGRSRRGGRIRIGGGVGILGDGRRVFVEDFAEK